MATAEQYAEWIVANQDKKGTPEFDTVARAYRAVKGSVTEAPKEEKYLPTNSVMAAPKNPNNPFDSMRGTMDAAGGLVTGMTGTARGALNLASPGMGNQAFPATNSDSGYAIAGSLLDPLALAIGGGVSKALPYAKVLGGGVADGAKAVGKNLISGAAMGAPIGALSAAGAGEDAAAGAGMGAAAGAAVQIVLPPVLKFFGNSAGRVWDTLSGKYGALNAKKILEQASGKDLHALKAAMAAAPADVTAAQAAAPVNNDMISALGKYASSSDTTNFYQRLAGKQAAARDATLAAVQPEMAFEQGARAAVSNPLYTAARTSGNVVNTAPIIDKIDDVLTRNPGNAELVRELSKIKDGILKSAPDIGFGPNPFKANAEKISSVIDGLKASKANKENKFILGNLMDIQNDLVKAVPFYEQAQRKFADASKPVNQSAVIQAMRDKLATPGGGENANALLKILGTGEGAMLRKSTGFPRYESGDLHKVLSPEQMSAVGNVAGQLERDKIVKEGANRGGAAVQGIISDNYSKFHLPNWINAKVAVTNRVLTEVEVRVNKRTAEILQNAMKSGKSFNEALSFIPTKDRSTVLKIIGDAGENPYVKAGILSSSLREEKDTKPGVLSRQ